MEKISNPQWKWSATKRSHVSDTFKPPGFSKLCLPILTRHVPNIENQGLAWMGSKLFPSTVTHASSCIKYYRCIKFENIQVSQSYVCPNNVGRSCSFNAASARFTSTEWRFPGVIDSAFCDHHAQYADLSAASIRFTSTEWRFPGVIDSALYRHHTQHVDVSVASARFTSTEWRFPGVRAA